MSTLLDTNILTRLAHPDHAQHPAARDAVKLLLERDEQLCIVPQNLYEFWADATRPSAANGLGMSTSETQKELSQLRRIFALLRDERGILSEWERLVARHSVQGRTTHDARLVAAMHRHRITHLLTFNVHHFARFPDIVCMTPENVLQTAE
ncbi:MAG: type II toxin-antitoxin system VapC family toxin [Phycisphaerae bacterium]|nr:type II toxin-antitoxin system VapC family toxin [Phycisphaerae bacterium]